MIDFQVAVVAVHQYITDNIEYPPVEDEENFKKACNMEWAALDLLDFIKVFWQGDCVVELISDYIDDARYRAEKYKGTDMGRVYKTAEETANEIALYFV